MKGVLYLIVETQNSNFLEMSLKILITFHSFIDSRDKHDIEVTNDNGMVTSSFSM